jgi:hypothetical protein
MADSVERPTDDGAKLAAPWLTDLWVLGHRRDLPPDAQKQIVRNVETIRRMLSSNSPAGGAPSVPTDVSWAAATAELHEALSEYGVTEDHAKGVAFRVLYAARTAMGDAPSVLSETERNHLGEKINDVAHRMVERLRASGLTRKSAWEIVRGFQELCEQRALAVAPSVPGGATPQADHSLRTTKWYEPMLGPCVCIHCEQLPYHDPPAEGDPQTEIVGLRAMVQRLEEELIRRGANWPTIGEIERGDQ